MCPREKGSQVNPSSHLTGETKVYLDCYTESEKKCGSWLKLGEGDQENGCAQQTRQSNQNSLKRLGESSV